MLADLVLPQSELDIVPNMVSGSRVAKAISDSVEGTAESLGVEQGFEIGQESFQALSC